jgi:hypothetical protein
MRKRMAKISATTRNAEPKASRARNTDERAAYLSMPRKREVGRLQQRSTAYGLKHESDYANEKARSGNNQVTET